MEIPFPKKPEEKQKETVSTTSKDVATRQTAVENNLDTPQNFIKC